MWPIFLDIKVLTNLNLNKNREKWANIIYFVFFKLLQILGILITKPRKFNPILIIVIPIIIIVAETETETYTQQNSVLTNSSKSAKFFYFN